MTLHIHIHNAFGKLFGIRQNKHHNKKKHFIKTSDIFLKKAYHNQTLHTVYKVIINH